MSSYDHEPRQPQPQPQPATPDVQTAAARGISSASRPLPFADQIQRAFGHHDISGIRAHMNDDATAAAHAMGAAAYAAGDHVVLTPDADLHTVAHEVAHVIQQRGGVRIVGGVGTAGDAHEQHADAVADLVVHGASAEALLDRHAGKPAAATTAAPTTVQRKLRTFDDIKPYGNGFSWTEHATQKTNSNGSQDAMTKLGLRTTVPGIVAAPETWKVKPLYGKPHKKTGEATSVSVRKLGPVAKFAGPPAEWDRPDDLALAIKKAAHLKHRPTYEAVQLLPARFAGSPDEDNQVAVPSAAKAQLEAGAHAALDRLVARAGAWVSYAATPVTAVDKVSFTPAGKKGKAKPKTITKNIPYTSAIDVEWDELDAKGTPVPGTRGELRINVPAPSVLVAGTSTLPEDIAPQLGGLDNRAAVPADRDAQTAATWVTRIDWGDTHKSGDGTSMEARLGPDHKQGDQPASGAGNIWNKRTAAMRAASGGRSYIAGHLLNHHVGGPGNDARNLAAIPGDVNSKMAKQVEKPVKDLVNHGYAWVHYKAEVSHAKDPGGSHDYYAKKLAFQWHQIDAKTGAAVAGTAGDVTYDVEAPSVIAGFPKPKKNAKKKSTFTPTATLPMLTDAQPQTAVSRPAFDHIILDEAPVVRTILIHQKHLIQTLRNMHLNPYIQNEKPAALARTVAEVFAAHTPGVAETGAWSDINKLEAKIAKLDPTVGADLEGFKKSAPKLISALQLARTERLGRTKLLSAAVNIQLSTMYGDPFAHTAWDDFTKGLEGYTKELEDAERLVETLAVFAKAVAEGLITEKARILDTANQLRTWLGQPPHPDTTDTSTLPSIVIDDVSEIAQQAFDYSYQPGSPGQWQEEFDDEYKGTGVPQPSTLKETKVKVFESSRKKRKFSKIAPHTPSNTMPRLLFALQNLAGVWPQDDATALGMGTSVVPARMIALARNVAVAGYDPDIHGPAVQKLYETEITNTKLYLSKLATWAQATSGIII